MKLIAQIIFIFTVMVSTKAFAEFSTGLQFLDDTVYQSIPLATTPYLGNLPKKVDLSSKFPSPGNQGRQGSCVGWATAYAFKSFQEKVERKWNLNDDDHFFSPAYIYNQINKSPDCRGGTTFVDALGLLRREGVAPLSSFPYSESNCTALPSAVVKQQAKEFAIADWRRVNAQDDVEIQTQIASGFPVLIGMMVDEGFQNLRGNSIYTNKSGKLSGGHAMVVVGYDEDISAYKVINSWGTEWGNGGFGWISYNAFHQTVKEAYTAQDIVLNPQNPVTTDTNRPNPPRPPPATLSPSANISTPQQFHNMQVASPQGPMPGMKIVIPTTVINAAGKRMQAVVKFNYLNGPPLNANPQENTFKDVGGLVTTGTLARPIGSNNESLNQDVSIPYYALNFAPSGGRSTYQLSFTVLVLLDNQLVSQSTPVPFTFNY